MKNLLKKVVIKIKLGNYMFEPFKRQTSKKIFFLILFLFNCRINPPCYISDSTCNVLGYFIPNLIRPPTSTSSSTVNLFPVNSFSGPGLIHLTWATQTGITSYKVYRKLTSGVTASDSEITNGGISTLSFTDNLATAGTRFYRVSFIRNGQEIFSNEVSASPNLTGLALFLRADSINQADNSSVNTWNDESGNGYNMAFISVSVCNQAPSFKTNTLNSKPIVRFNGSSNCLTRQGPNPNLTNGTNNYPQTDFLVYNRVPTTTADYIFVIGDMVSGSATGSNEINYGTNNDLAHGSTGLFVGATTNVITNEFLLLSVSANSTGTNYTATLALNGLNIVTRSNPGGGPPYNYGTPTGIRIGISQTTTLVTGSFFQGDLAELIHYNRQLSTFEQNQVLCYLSSKYNISLSTVSCTN
jgi:hypothetical protein